MKSSSKTIAARTCWRFFEKRADGFYSRNGTDHKWTSEKWVRHDGDLVLCQEGLHASTTVYEALRHAQGDTIAEVEVRGIGTEEDGKLVAREIRIVRVFDDKKYVVALASLAAIRVLPIFEKRFPDDKRPRKAISATLNFLSGAGTATLEKFREAATRAAAAAAATRAAAEAAAEAAAAATRAAAAAAWAWAWEAAEAAEAAAALAFKASFHRDALELLAVPAEKLGARLEDILAEQDAAAKIGAKP